MRNISAVHRPMPLTRTRCATTSSSLHWPIFRRSRDLFKARRERSLRKLTFIAESPALLIFTRGIRSTSCGPGNDFRGKSSLKRFVMVAAAFPESCWLIMASTRDLKCPSRAPSVRSFILSITFRNTGSLRRRCAIFFFMRSKSLRKRGCFAAHVFAFLEHVRNKPRNCFHLPLSHSPAGQGGRPDADPRRAERRARIIGGRVAFHDDAATLKPVLRFAAGEPCARKVDEHKMVVCAARDQRKAEPHKLVRERSRVFHNCAAVRPKRGLERLAQCDRDRRGLVGR